MVFLTALMIASRVDLTIDNFQPAEVVRYPVVILNGSAEGPEMAVGTSWSTAIRFPVVNHRYTALVELKNGINWLLVHSGSETMKFRLDYKPMTTSYKVAAVWVKAPGELEANDPKDRLPTRQRFDVAMKLMQAFTADAMYRAGYGRKTFALELDKDGKVEVHFPASSTRPIVHDKLAEHSQAFFGAKSMQTWPASLKDVPKAFPDITAIDPAKAFEEGGFAHLRWPNPSTAFGAAELKDSPWFQPDEKL